MTTSISTLASILKSSGYSVTKPRREVFKQLLGQEPISMHELVEQCQNVDRASVYRTVTLFEELGVVIRINIGWKYKLELSEAFSSHHHHMSCVKCGKTIALDEVELEKMIEKLCAAKGFKSTAHQVEIQGECTGCI